jgi:hypothetical protein
MRAHRWLPGFLVFALASTAGARPEYSLPLSGTVRAQARNDLLEHAKTEGRDTDDVNRRLNADVVATTSDTGCPGVDIDVANATDHTTWYVELEIKQEQDGKTRDERIHLPYLASSELAHARVECMTLYRDRYSASKGINLGYQAHSAPTMTEALTAMRDHKVDYAMTADRLSPVSSPGSGARSLLAEALALEDPEVAQKLVLGIARSGIGIQELGDEIARVPDGAIATQAAGALAKAPAATQVGLARALLSSSAAGTWQSTLLPLIDGRLCRGKRDAIVQLWIQAQSEHAMPVAELRDRVRAKCALSPSDGPVLAALLSDAPERAGAALDALAPALLDSVLIAWQGSNHLGVLGAYARDTGDATRFDRAIAALPTIVPPQVIADIAKAPANPIAPHKAAWLSAAFAQLRDREPAVSALTDELIRGEITADPMHEAVRAARAMAPDAAKASMTAYASAHPMFYLDKLGTDVDAGELLAFVTTTLGHCDSSLDTARACIQAIGAHQHGALAKVAATAAREELLGALRKPIAQVSDPAQLATLVKPLREAGLPGQLATERTCREAMATRDPEDKIAQLAAIDPDAPCITQIRDAAASYHRRVIWLTIFGILGLILPFPAGGFAIRRRYRKLQRELPPIEADDSGHGDKRADRLGATLGRGLRAGVTAAAAELSHTAAGPALARIDDAVLAAATDTVGRAVRAGDAATVLVRRADDAVYLVALPVRHARPQIVQRYLGAPWPEHIAAVQRAAGTSVLALIVLCDPEANEAQLLVGVAPAPGDARPTSDPEALLDAKAARERGANPFRYVMPLSAAPASTPASTPAVTPPPAPAASPTSSNEA